MEKNATRIRIGGPCLALAVVLFAALAAPALASAGRYIVVFRRDSFRRTFEAVRSGMRVPRTDVEKALREDLSRSRRRLDALLGTDRRSRNVEWLSVVNGAVLELSDEEARRLRRDAGIEMVVPDLPVEPPREIPVDPGRSPEEEDVTYGLKLIGADRVQDELGITGRGVLVGHIDTGVDGEHPELAGKIAGWKDFTSHASTEPEDTHGHGTHTAATIVGGNLSGKRIGVAPGARLLVARGIGGGTSGLLKAMQWMVDPDGDPSTDDAPALVSCSWNSGYGEQDPFYEALATWEACGIIPVFSAGNAGPKPGTITKPKEYPGTFATAAVDSQSEAASFSSRGPAVWKGKKVDKPDFAAPGVAVYSAVPHGRYGKKSGTSMAAPHLAGAVALILEAAPGLAPQDVRNLLRNTAKDLGDEGYDYTYGWGLIDVYAAVKAVLNGARVDGVVFDGDGKPLAGALIRLEKPDRTIKSDSRGRFVLYLPEGRHEIRVEAFAHLPLRKVLEVHSNDHLRLELRMKKAPVVSVEVSVKGREDGAPVEGAVVKVTGTPLEAVKTGADGIAVLELPTGEYTLRVEAFGFRPAEVEVEAREGAGVEVLLRPLPPVLLVDDDGGGNFEKYYEQAFRKLGIEYDIVRFSETSPYPDKDHVLAYAFVVWETGNASSHTIGRPETELLEAYLDAGGRLILSGQDIGYDIKQSPFFKKYLKARYFQDNAGSKRIRSIDGSFEFDIAGGDGADNQRYPDAIDTAGAGSRPLYLYDREDRRVAALRIEDKEKGYRIDYYAFGIEAVTPVYTRAKVLEKSLEFLNGGPLDSILRTAVSRSRRLPARLKPQYVERVLLPLMRKTRGSRTNKYERLYGHLE